MSRQAQRRLRLAALLLLGVILYLMPYRHFTPPDDLLQAVRERDFLSVHTRNTPTTYYEGRHGPTGFEYELMRRFANHLDVSLTLDASHHIMSVIDTVRREGDLGPPRCPWIRRWKA
ncbi:hypothetical protein Q427_05630 [Halomonas sp. BC04]|nr:hypothetical protein Q427_05630 [Halomonas sp. BC04]